MPLSEREQRILDEIEKSLYQEDTEPARRSAGRATPGALSTARRGAVLFAAGLAALFVFFLMKQVWIGALAFGSMVWGIVVVAGSLRAGSSTDRRPFADYGERFGRKVGDFEDRIRQRYKRP